MNDTRHALTGAVLELSVEGRITRWTGDVPADGIAYVGTVDLADAVDVEIVLTHDRIERVVNRYPLLILRAGESGRAIRGRRLTR